MIQAYTLADLRRTVARLSFGVPVVTIGDLYPNRIYGSLRRRRQSFREWLKSGARHEYTASDTVTYVGGSVWTWQDSGGTKTMTLNGGSAGLASGSSRQGVKSATTIVAPPNGGTNAVPPAYFAIQFLTIFALAPTAGGEVQIYFGFSPSATAGTSNPAGLTGADAAGPNSDRFPQLTFAGSLIASNDIGVSTQYQTPFAMVNTDPTNSPYMCPLIFNTSGTGQAFAAAANSSVLSVIPYWLQRAT